MKSIKLTVFDYDGRRVQFDTDAFRKAVYEYRAKTGQKISDIEEMIATSANVSVSAVHNWRSGNNGPGDIVVIKNIAKALEISDFNVLLKSVVEEKRDTDMNDLQIQSAKRIYDAFVKFLFNYNVTNDYKSVWKKLRASFDEEVARERLREYICHQLEKVELVLLQEYFYLHDTELYSSMLDMYYEDFDNVYGYCDIGIEGSTVVGGKNINQLIDYDYMLNRINVMLSMITL